MLVCRYLKRLSRIEFKKINTVRDIKNNQREGKPNTLLNHFA